MMKIDDLIELVDSISLELNWVKDTIEPEEYDSSFEENLDTAHDLLCEVKDLIGA